MSCILMLLPPISVASVIDNCKGSMAVSRREISSLLVAVAYPDHLQAGYQV